VGLWQDALIKGTLVVLAMLVLMVLGNLAQSMIVDAASHEWLARREATDSVETGGSFRVSAGPNVEPSSLIRAGAT
jgi:hypothetical protein